jgi:methanethiol S-methyltransferase
MPATSRAPLVVAWGGAGMFAISLLYFLYCYLVRFGSPVPDGAIGLPAFIDTLLFTAFALHHSVFARTSVKSWVARYASRLERSVFTWIASLLFILVCALWQPVPGELYHLQGPVALLGYAMQAAGLLLTARGSARLDVLDLAGVRPVQVQSREHVALETTGLYGFVRHPIYFAWALFVFGAPHMTMTRFVFAAVSTAYLAVAIRFEERALVASFGTAYRDYQRTVRWRMIPWLY